MSWKVKARSVADAVSGHRSKLHLKERCFLFGGSFDPPHIGHRDLIKGLMDRASIDGASHIRIVPAALSPFKQESHAGNHHRLTMLELLLRELPAASIHRASPSVEPTRASSERSQSAEDGESRPVESAERLDCPEEGSGQVPVILDTYEIDQGGVSYTVRTVQYLHTMDLDPILVIGADNLYSLEKWKEHSFLLEQVPILVFRREGQDAGMQDFRDQLVRDNRVRSIEILDLCPPGCSSTAIRKAIQKRFRASVNPEYEGKGTALKIEECLPSSVLKYIQKHQLYVSPS
ncbi:MAG: hypothetical protein CMF59_09535 [Leptospiraceae bacterium]|nr:hypothetical protein [Leptospiraceae bacterium]